MSQKALAVAAGVSQPLVSEIENNAYAGSTNIVQLARAVGVNPLWLESNRGPRLATDSPAAAPAPQEEAEMRRHPFSIVPAELSTDTVEALRELLDRAEAGEVIGIAYAAMIKGRHYIVDTAGELHRNPTFARGVIRALDDELGRRVWGD